MKINTKLTIETYNPVSQIFIRKNYMELMAIVYGIVGVVGAAMYFYFNTGDRAH